MAGPTAFFTANTQPLSPSREVLLTSPPPLCRPLVAKASNSEDPLHTTDTAPAAKGKGSLSFSTGTSTKTKAGGVGGHGDWADVVRSSRDGDGGVQRTSAGTVSTPGGGSSKSTTTPGAATEDKAKAEKKKSKEKKKAKKQIGLLSFDDE